MRRNVFIYFNFQVGQDKKANDDTRILYCTTGVLLQKLIAKKDMREFTHVVLDEIHERDQDMDFLLIVVRRLLNTNSKGVKVRYSIRFEFRLTPFMRTYEYTIRMCMCSVYHTLYTYNVYRVFPGTSLPTSSVFCLLNGMSNRRATK